MEIKRKLCSKYGITDDGRLVNVETGQEIPLDEPVFLLRARDTHALATVGDYHYNCAYDEEVPKSHVQGIDYAFLIFQGFKKEHPERMKVPGTKPAGATHTGSGV